MAFSSNFRCWMARLTVAIVLGLTGYAIGTVANSAFTDIQNASAEARDCERNTCFEMRCEGDESGNMDCYSDPQLRLL